MRRCLIPLLVIALLSSSAWGAKGGKSLSPTTTVDMPYLMVPMTQEGKLLGYAYVVSKLECSSAAACEMIRGKLAFIQDAFVRDVNGRPVSLASDPTAVDRAQLNQRLTGDAKRIMGGGKVVKMVFVDIRFAPLHPSESTAGLINPPDQGPGGAPAAPQPANGAAQKASKAAATSKRPGNQAR